ncbi:MAG: hypothetical protein RRA35_03265 [Desulfomonilia bacterium]|nr:hypothetical protein [Desulfomonilia bacterium]
MKHIALVSIIFSLLFWCSSALIPSISCAGQAFTGKSLSDSDLAGITGQAGISINLDITLDYTADTVAWGDRDGHGSTYTDPGWVGFDSLTIENLHLWPRTDYSMDTSNWHNLRFLTLDVATVNAAAYGNALSFDFDPFEGNVDDATMVVIGIPTITLSIDRTNTEWMMGPNENSGFSIGGQLGGDYAAAKHINKPDFNQTLGEFEMEDFNLSTGPDGYLLIGAHGTDATTLPGFTGSGVSIFAHDTKVRLEIGSWSMKDTDTGSTFLLEGITIDDGAGGHFSFDTPVDIPIMFDVGSTTDGWTVARAILSHHTQPRTYSADTVRFCNEALGSLLIENFREGPALLLFAAHQDGSTGIDFEYHTTMTIDAFTYTYNTVPEALVASGIHIAGQASGAPENPAAWSFQDLFQIGDLDGEEIDVDDDPNNATVANPATFDVGTDPASGNTTMMLGLPMQGTLRVENVTFGSNDFGPCAIDGITVHKLNVTLSPN